MASIILLPFVAFFIVLSVAIFQMYLMSKVAPQGKESAGKRKSYACGEDLKAQRINPDYQQFFPFAFFFTVMHVVALIVATVPAGKLPVSTLTLACVYIAAAIVSLFILFRR